MTTSHGAHSIARPVSSWLMILGLAVGARPARGQDIYFAVLTPDDSEMVSVDSLQFGVATFAVGEDAIIYSIWLHNVDRVTAVHLRADRGGSDSIGVVRLYEGKGTGTVDGRLTSGWFRAKAVAGMAWDDFLAAVETSCVTVDVAFGGSELHLLTGQIVPLEAPADSVLPPQLAAWSAADTADFADKER